MASNKKISKKSAGHATGAHNGSGKKNSGTGTDKRYVRRDAKDDRDVGRSLAQDVKKNSKTSVKSSQSDRYVHRDAKTGRFIEAANSHMERAWEKIYERHR